jgi:hypothetical protein
MGTFNMTQGLVHIYNFFLFKKSENLAPHLQSLINQQTHQPIQQPAASQMDASAVLLKMNEFAVLTKNEKKQRKKLKASILLKEEEIKKMKAAIVEEEKKLERELEAKRAEKAQKEADLQAKKKKIQELKQTVKKKGTFFLIPIFCSKKAATLAAEKEWYTVKGNALENILQSTRFFFFLF